MDLARSLDTNNNGTIDAGDATGFIDDGSYSNSQAGNGMDDRIESERNGANR